MTQPASAAMIREQTAQQQQDEITNAGGNVPASSGI
jgi:hypothetical protein